MVLSPLLSIAVCEMSSSSTTPYNAGLVNESGIVPRVTSDRKSDPLGRKEVNKVRCRLIFAMVVSVLFLGPIASAVTAQGNVSQVEEDRGNAAKTARDVLSLAAEHDFNAMYDLMHPDAKAVVPRSAVVGAFDEIYTSTQAGPAEIVGVELTTYTWPVTGKEYPNAVKISFVQPITDESGEQTWIEDAMYLAKDSAGNWGWFFGSDPETVQAAIEKYGSSNEAPTAATGTSDTPLTQGDFIVNTVNDLDDFWRDVLSYTDYIYESPGVVIVAEGDSAISACGPAQTGFWAFYCPLDSKVYLDERLLNDLIDQGYDFAAAFVIAHEWAHHIQDGVGFTRTGAPDEWNEVHSIDLELMADCMAGAWARDANTRGILEEGDIEEAAQFAIEVLGDPAYVGEYDEQAHGTGEQRVSAIMGGYEEGFLACNLLI
jgi:predicted metalloprotease